MTIKQETQMHLTVAKGMKQINKELKAELALIEKQGNCKHSFTDDYHDTTCYKCGYEVNF